MTTASSGGRDASPTHVGRGSKFAPNMENPALSASGTTGAANPLKSNQKVHEVTRAHN